jgi:hypothetical protein
MRKTLLITTGLAWLALTGAAGAVTVTLKEGPADPQYFASTPVGESDFSVGTTMWSGGGMTESGSLAREYAAPLGMGDTTYMSVFGGTTETATFATPQTSISIYWGSIDPGNTFAVSVAGVTLTGADLVAYGANDDGSQTSPTSNQWVTISGFTTPFTTASFSSVKNSFEFSIASGVPEPSTWAMMGLGFAALGYAAFRRNSKGRMAISAI